MQLSDQEMNELEALNREAIVFFALAASALSFALGLWIEPSPASGTPEISAARAVLIEIGVPFFTLIATLTAGLGYLTLRRRAVTVDAFAKRAQELEADLTFTETSEPGIVAAAREPARTLLRW